MSANLKDKIEMLRDIIHNSDNIVFFGGAGVSTESGIPDFRSVDGLYNQKYDYPPETIFNGPRIHLSSGTPKPTFGLSSSSLGI